MPKTLVSVDLTSVLSGDQLVQLTKEAQAEALDRAINAAHAEMTRLALTTLHVTQQTYINGIQQPEIMGMQASIALVGQLPNMIENGQDAYDMHNTLLGPNVPVVEYGSGQKGKHLIKKGPKKGGFFRAIPFRHATPGTVGAVGAAMGSAYQGHAEVRDAQALGASIYAAAKKLKGSKIDPNRPGKTAWGGRLPAGMAPLLRPHHKSDIYAGMVKLRKEYSPGVFQSSYMSFRAISSGSNGWVRRATEGVHFFWKTAKFVQSILPALMQAILSSR